jgi:hypothetical protein
VRRGCGDDVRGGGDFCGAVIRSTLGLGEALVTVPVLALRIPNLVATALAVTALVVIALAVVAQDWRHVEVRSAARLDRLVAIALKNLRGPTQFVPLVDIATT